MVSANRFLFVLLRLWCPLRLHLNSDRAEQFRRCFPLYVRTRAGMKVGAPRGQTDGGIAHSVAAHTQDTCCKTGVYRSASGRTTGIMMDSGDNVSHTALTYDGQAMHLVPVDLSRYWRENTACSRECCCTRQEKLTGPRAKDELMGARLVARGSFLLLPSLDMQLRAYPELPTTLLLRGLQRVRWAPLRCKLLLHQNAPSSPRPAAYSEFSNLRTRLRRHRTGC